MKFHSKKIASSKEFPIFDCKSPIQNRKSEILNWKFLTTRPAFSLVEAVMALIVLALVSSSVLVVTNRCMTSAADSTTRRQAFEIARENMEKILASSSVKEMIEYGSSDKYPDIQWQTTVESFYEPISSRMWIRAICLADYIDTAGELQSVELTHWLTSLSKRQLMQIIEQKQKEKEQLAEQGLLTIEEAAEYAGVDEQTIQQWVRNDMPKTNDGYYIKDWLDLYRENNGNPPAEEIRRLGVVRSEAPGRQRVRPTEQRQPSPRDTTELEEEPKAKPSPAPEAGESPADWPDWLPPKSVWDSMTRGEQLRFLFSTISG